MTDWHLAQLNIARMKYPLDDSRMVGFVDQLDEINAIADGADGFIWRLQTEAGNATDLRPFPDETLIANLSAWDSVEALREYVYRTAHVGPLRSRREWFEKIDGAFAVMWWVPAGHVPTLDEASLRLELLNREGPSPLAFDFRHPHEPPS